MVTYIEPLELLTILFYHNKQILRRWISNWFCQIGTSDFKKKDENQPVIPDWLFEACSNILFKPPYCPSNEHDVKRFFGIIKSFTGDKIKLIVLWSTRNIKSLLPLKDKVVH